MPAEIVVEVIEIVKVIKGMEVIESEAETKHESEKRRPIKSVGVAVAIIRITVWIGIWVPVIHCRPIRVRRCLIIDSCRLWRQSMHQPGPGRLIIAGPSAGRLV